ncbi:DUF3450 family protein [Aidingimonas halophila]|uniref:Biopolymer transport protein ExbB/TolQ n=1 Tax=Aidingimonas halophila TaxID=574349 RepID=A0A1H2QL96_9GAMM|nr:MotA/TolQ/ExbB proton channel family protein [Aidingimonas halophila]GHC20665.1 hypothetical protein GCM10008094_08730 [Aidingimonas halophila]SDW07434.1 Biopolymer transport protein ExbB/TolQ [Aidingimonas halophila]
MFRSKRGSYTIRPELGLLIVLLWCLSASTALAQAQEEDSPRVEVSALAWMSPLMMETVNSVRSLEAFIEDDMPFLNDERQARVNELEHQLETTGVTPALYERLLSAWRSELDYGREMDSWRGLLVGDDRREVEYLRIGRIGFYYLTPDGNEGGVWQVEQGDWRSLEDDDLAELKKAIQVSQERRAPELLTLPLSVDNDPDGYAELGTGAAELLNAPVDEALFQEDETEAILSAAVSEAGDLRDSLNDTWVLHGGIAGLPPRLDEAQVPDTRSAAMVLSSLRGLAEETGRIRHFEADVVDSRGAIESRDVIRLGGIQAVAGDDLLSIAERDVGEASARLRVVEGLPSAAHEQIRVYSEGQGSRIPMDPSDGRVLEALAQQPSLLDRFHQGGVVGYVIVGLGGLGLLVALGQYLYLLRVSLLLRRQLGNLDRLSQDNPLGRVLRRFFSLDAGHAPEALEARLDEALLAEQPKLERGQPLVKLLAAVAPLLGLLGTVTGMIVTFQSITVYGTGDPQLMAGGISQALVTTVLGLITAVPLLFAHTALSSRSRRLIGILEGRASAVLASRLETIRQESEHRSDAHALV